METSVAVKPLKIVKPGISSVSEYLSEMWKYKNLVLVFAQQEFKVQYVQTRFNWLWVVFRPLMVLALFTFIFGKLITIPGVHYPYPLFAFSGLIIWNNFGFLINNAGNAVMSSQNLVKKIYFPRIILVFSKALVGLIEVSTSILLLIALIVLLRYPLRPQILFLPFFIIISLVPGLAVAIWMNALTIRNRDLNHFVPILLGFVIWLTPVFYPVTLIPAEYSFILYLNPIAGAIQGCRWAVLGDAFPNIMFLPSVIGSFVFLLAGFLTFIRVDSDLADYI
jgi:lipopolysaccharide transport system permease protein